MPEVVAFILVVVSLLAGGYAILLLIGGRAAEAIAALASTPSPGAVRAAPRGGFPVQLTSSTSTPLRFVVLHHTGVAQPHFDLMFETGPGSALATWRSAVWPIVKATPLERVADHRRDYLQYEGAVSGGRGEVRRVLADQFQLAVAADGHWEVVTAQGLRLRLRRYERSDLWVGEAIAEAGVGDAGAAGLTQVALIAGDMLGGLF
jgi:hypothetical protein